MPLIAHTPELKKDRQQLPLLPVPDRRDFPLLVAMLIVILFAIGCYLPSLWSGFMGDDYFAYSYFFQAFRSDPWALLQNFTGSWMSSQLRELHYRPFMLIPHAFDCLVWRFNPIGYHLTNILIHAACSVLVFLIANAVFKSFRLGNDLLGAFLSALLFAVHPLHAEAVSWIAGRVDSFCTLLYLISLYSFIHSKHSGNGYVRAVSYISAFASMMCKEIGAALPAVIGLYCFCINVEQHTIGGSCKRALHETRIYWGILFAYLIIRTMALKTLVGGYVGLTGVMMESSVLSRLQNVTTYEKILLPVPLELKQESTLYIRILCLLNCCMGVMALVRLWLFRPGSQFARLFFFNASWMVAQFAIVTRVWPVTDSLAGGRHFYLLSVPYCILTTLLMLPPLKRNSRHIAMRDYATCLIVVYCCVLSVISFQQNKFWTEAAKYSDNFRDAIMQQITGSDATRFLVMNPPATHNHICMYPTFEVLRGLFAWPFCVPDFASKINTLEPYFYNRNLINASAMRMVLADNTTQVVCWNDRDESATTLTRHPAISSATSTECDIKPNPQPDRALSYTITPRTAIDQYSIDCVEVCMRSPANKKNSSEPHFITLSWSAGNCGGDNNNSMLWPYVCGDGSHILECFDKSERLATSLTMPLIDDGEFHTYRFHLSQMTSWFLFGNLQSLNLGLSQSKSEYDIRSVQLMNLSTEIPSLWLDKRLWSRMQNGTYSCSNRHTLIVDYDASKIKGAVHVAIEVSEPDMYWDYFISSHRQRRLADKKLKRFRLNALRGQWCIPATLFPREADYQIHAAAVDASGAVVGYVSDPINIHASPGNMR